MNKMFDEPCEDWDDAGVRPMRRFGPGGNPELKEVPTPVGVPCAWCEEVIEEGDRGQVIDHFGEDGVSETPYHRECLFRTIIGSVGHIRGKCSCFGGDQEDPEGMSKREAAIAACKEYEAARDNERT
jgi:hypothetical protein